MSHLKNKIGVPFVVVLLLLCSSAFAERPAWTTSRIQGAPTAPLPYETKRVFGDYQFKQPVELSSAPHTDSMFLLELDGSIFELTSETAAEPVLIDDLSKHVSKFNQSFGLAFHPKFEENREVYICYKRGGQADPDGTVLARFRLTDTQPMRIEPKSEEILYTWLAGGHNGGSVQFGPDGYLYISAGDAAAPFPPDPYKAGQDVGTLLSTITRIDVDKRDGELPYGIPTDNPFVDLAGAKPEVYAYGFRNPWRMSFDRETGDLWVGDVGWELWEMIHRVESGGNYGWSIVEGPQKLNNDYVLGPTPIRKAVANHAHTEARSITGGQVYYGDSLPDLRGKYVYGDLVTGRIWTLTKKGDSYETPVQIARANVQIICFGLHNNGELYVVDYLGSVHRLVARKQETNEKFPTKLSESGLFSDTAAMTLAEGVMPYSVIAEPWMDGATASRIVAVPEQQKIGVYKINSGQANWDGKHKGSWKFPKDSVLGKTISLEDRRIETQLMHYDGKAWQAYTYLWNDEQTDAELADDVTKTIEFNVDGKPKKWLVSNRGDCMICHSNANDMLLGFKPNQLRRPVQGQDEQIEDQLDHFASVGLFEEEPRTDKTLVSPHDASANLDTRARAYLHTNCAFCHRPQGGGSVAMNVLFDQSPSKMRMLDEAPLQGTFGIDGANVVTSGDPYSSVLLYRFCKTGPGHMPKLGGLEVDQAGATLLHDWIASLDMSGEASKRLEANMASLHDASTSNKLGEWLTNPMNGLVAAHAIRSKSVDDGLRQKILDTSLTLPTTSKDLFEPFIPIEKRTKRLGDNIEPAYILADGGDSARGRELFLSGSLSCKTCHAIERGKAAVGPNLAELGEAQYQPAVLLENILHPSKVVEERYRTHVLQTVDGEVFTGTVSDEPDFAVLRDAEGKTHRVNKDDIEFRKVSEVSLMPEKLLATLTLQQAKDLIAFLTELGK